MRKPAGMLTFIVVIVCVVAGGYEVWRVARGEPDLTEPIPEIASSQVMAAERPVATPLPEINVNLGDSTPVSRALAAKMLTLAYIDANTISHLDREIAFSDTDVSKWYDKYINAAFIHDIMSGSSGLFMPDEPLTLGQAQSLLDRLDDGNKVKVQLTVENRDKPVSYALWMEMYKKFFEIAADDKTIREVFGIDERSVVVLATPGNNSLLPAFNLITDKGPLTSSGLAMDGYIDKRIRILVKDREIISVLAVEDTSPVMKNCYIVKSGNGEITIFTGGVERTYNYAKADNTMAGSVCDISINEDVAEEVVVFSENIKDVVNRTTDAAFECRENGIIPVGGDFKVYSLVDGAVKWKTLSSVVVGTDIADLFLRDGEICAAVITKNAQPNTIRVAISDTGFKSLIHDSVAVTANTDYTVTFINQGVENSEKYKAGEVLKISASENKNLFGAERLYIETNQSNGLIELKGLKRNWPGEVSPAYRGVIEIALESGGYSIVNEIGLEEYLYSVVPSEMPSGHGVEASKVQAVTARSYAYNQYFANRFHKYGANVDDSVSCQVYNNIPENDVSIRAVDATAGQCLTYNGKVVSATFFSTSSGMTANDGEVWQNSATKQFPAATSPYLVSVKQYTGEDYGDLRVEENAERFFKDTKIDSFDNGFSWFRWNVEMTAEEIAASINANIRARYDASPWMIKIQQESGIFRSRPVDGIGVLKDLQVTKRGEGGNILEMKITGTEAVVLVSTEYNIRVLIRPYKYISGGRDIALNRLDAAPLNNYSLMPSAFYTMDKKMDGSGTLESVTFYGGGNGHGSGMSQNGVKGMIDEGYVFADILEHYYQGCEITRMY